MSKETKKRVYDERYIGGGVHVSHPDQNLYVNRWLRRERLTSVSASVSGSQAPRHRDRGSGLDISVTIN